MAIDTSSSPNILTVIANQQYTRDSAANTALTTGINLMQKKRYKEATTAFKQAIAYRPDMGNAHTFLGDAYSRLGDKKSAAAAYELSLKVDKTQDATYSSLANTYVDLKRPADAEKVLKKAIQANNLNTPAYYTLGLLQAQKGDYKSAEAQFRKVIQLEPKDGNGYYGLGMALNGQNKSRDAINPLEKATKLKKNFDAAINELGKAYLNIGDTEKVQLQIDKLNKISTGLAAVSSATLSSSIQKPGIFYYDASKSSLQLSTGPIDLNSLDSTAFSTQNAAQSMTVSFAFDSPMNLSSVTNVSNWSISKAAGGTAGIYNNGLYSPQNVPTPIMPNSVSYDSEKRLATLVFTVAQNSTVDGTIDPSHLVFKFKGQDERGMTMDPKADEFDGFRSSAF